MASRSTGMTLTFNPDVGMRTSELDYELPPELIAQRPLERRDESRLLVFDRTNGAVEHRRFRDLGALIASSTLVVVNDTRVLPARITLDRPTGGRTEVLLLERVEGDVWEALARPSRRLREGMRLGPVELLQSLGEGRWRLRLSGEPAGEAPLPPYITEPLADAERYQTVYADESGSAAAPTAGVYFTPQLLPPLHVERGTPHLRPGTVRALTLQTLAGDPLYHERHEGRGEAGGGG